MTPHTPWVDLKEVCGAYGYTYDSAKNAIRAGRFPVCTYKVGRRIVIARELHESYFDRKRRKGMRALDKLLEK